MTKIVAWLRTIPFLICFSILMVSCDFLLRFFWSKKNHQRVNPFLNKYVLKFLNIFCGTKFNYHYADDFKSALERDYPKLIVANHQSLMDIAILNFVFNGQSLRFLAKKELARYLPYVSIALRRLPHCLIDRNDRAQALREIREYCDRLRAEQAIMVIFPEGTRARDGKMKRFKTGGIQAVVEELQNVLIFPVAINGSYLIAKNKMLPVPSNIKVDFHALSPVLVNKDDDVKFILDQMESAIGMYTKTH